MKKPLTLNGMKLLSMGLVLLLLLNHAKAGAQNSSSPFSAGVKTGLSNGYFAGQDYVGLSGVRHGINAGIFANYEIAPLFDIRFEILYVKTGAQQLNPGYLYSPENKVFTDKITNCDITMNSLNIPLLFGVTIPGIKGSFKPLVYLGGDFNMCFKPKSVNIYSGSGADGAFYYQKNESLGDRLLKNDFGFIAGTGFSFTQGNFSYLFDIRYRMGLKNLNNTTSDYVSSKMHSHVISTSFGVGYHF